MLVRTIESSLGGLDVVDVRPMVGRVVIRFGPAASTQWDEIRTRLSRLPGVGNFSRATHVAPDLEAIASAVSAAAAAMAAAGESRSFRVTARRADKRFAIP